MGKVDTWSNINKQILDSFSTSRINRFSILRWYKQIFDSFSTVSRRRRYSTNFRGNQCVFDVCTLCFRFLFLAKNAFIGFSHESHFVSALIESQSICSVRNVNMTTYCPPSYCSFCWHGLYYPYMTLNYCFCVFDQSHPRSSAPKTQWDSGAVVVAIVFEEQ